MQVVGVWFLVDAQCISEAQSEELEQRCNMLAYTPERVTRLKKVFIPVEGLLERGDGTGIDG